MKKINALLFTILFAFASYGQLSGDIVKDNRKMTSSQGFIIDGHVNGKIVFEIAVDAKGNVSSARALDNESTVKSTPAKVNARNYVSAFTFAPGTFYPEHHQGRVVITMVKQK